MGRVAWSWSPVGSWSLLSVIPLVRGVRLGCLYSPFRVVRIGLLGQNSLELSWIESGRWNNLWLDWKARPVVNDWIVHLWFIRQRGIDNIGKLDDCPYYWVLGEIISSREDTGSVVRNCVLSGGHTRRVMVARREAVRVLVEQLMQFGINVGCLWVDRIGGFICRIPRLRIATWIHPNQGVHEGCERLREERQPR